MARESGLSPRRSARESGLSPRRSARESGLSPRRSSTVSVGFFQKPDQIDALIQKYRHETLDPDEDDDEEELADQKFVDAWWFNSFVALLIFANALTIGLETDANRNSGSTGTWYLIEVCFVLAFTGELICRLQQHKSSFFLEPGERGWNIMDFAIVGFSVIDVFILMPLGISNALKFISMLRFVRLMRLVRLIRLLRFFRELWLVASGLLQALRTLFWIVMVLFVLCYIGSTFLTLMVGRNNRDYNAYFKESTYWDHELYFSTVWASMFTFFQIVTLDNWAELIVRHIGKVQPGMYMFFVIFLCVAVFGVLNLMVGVVVERAIRTAAIDQREEKLKHDRDRQLVFKQLRDIFENADVDNSGTLSLEEVQEAINKPEIYNKLRMIDFPVDNPKEVFVLLDYDNTGELTIEEFIKGCLRMKGPAMSKDLLVAQVAIDGMAKQYQLFETELRVFKQKLSKLDATARAVANQGEKIFFDPSLYRVRHPNSKDRQGSTSSSPWSGDRAPFANSQPMDSGTPLRQAAAGDARPAWQSDLAQLRGIQDGEQNHQAALQGAPAPPALPDGLAKRQARAVPRSLAAIEDNDHRQLALPGAMN